MKETNLKKEFDKKTVQRMRNIITGKFGDKTSIQSGWEKNSQVHKEGDIWEEGGRSWTIRNGIKRTVPKMNEFKQLVVLPLACPKCSEAMKVNEFNKKSYAIYGTCFDCAIKIETDLKISGEFEKKMVDEGKAYANDLISDMERALDHWYQSKDDTYINEQGDVEDWAGGDKNRIYEDVKGQLNKLKTT
jgi:hypothetical protein